MLRRVALAAILAVLATAPALAQQPADAPVFVVYHAWPDPETGQPGADPFSTPDALPLPGLAPDRLPAARADATLLADPAAEGNPASSVAQVTELQRIVKLRQATGAGAILDVDGRLDPGLLVVDVNVTATEALGRVEARVVLVEDGVAYDAGGGVQQLRFVARAATRAEAANLSAPGDSFAFEREIPLNASVGASRAGAVVSLRVLGPASATRQTGEVVQSAWWTPRQAGPTRQVEKAVLVEHLTATWCEPCGPQDQAIDLLAARTAPAPDAARYLQAPTLAAAVGLAAGVAAFVLLVRRRAA